MLYVIAITGVSGMFIYSFCLCSLSLKCIFLSSVLVALFCILLPGELSGV